MDRANKIMKLNTYGRKNGYVLEKYLTTRLFVERGGDGSTVLKHNLF
jgi:hypothetical protein